MVLDPTSTSTLPQRPERTDLAPAANQPGQARQERIESGATSEAAPSVVVSLSAAARETARPVNEADQGADSNPSRKSATPADAGQGGPQGEAKAGSRLDIVV